MLFYDIVILIYDGDVMKRILKYILFFIMYYFICYKDVFAIYDEAAMGIMRVLIGLFSIFFGVVVSVVVTFVAWKKRQNERKKDNVEDRNHTGLHAALDSNDAKDREFIDYIEATENRSNKLLADYFNKIADLKYIKAHSSEALYNNIVDFIKTNEKNDKYIVVKGTVVNGNEIKTKDGNIFTTDVIIECYNYMEDSRGHYLCGYKVNKEFVRKRIEFSFNNKEIYVISIEEL